MGGDGAGVRQWVWGQGYIVDDGGDALLVDTAYNAPLMLEQLRRRGLRLLGICLTHGHADHADGIEQILDRYEVPVYLGPEDVELSVGGHGGVAGGPG